MPKLSKVVRHYYKYWVKYSGTELWFTSRMQAMAVAYERSLDAYRVEVWSSHIESKEGETSILITRLLAVMDFTTGLTKTEKEEEWL